jgi:hypothetical protein
MHPGLTRVHPVQMGVAQLAEQRFPKPQVAGSIPSAHAIFSRCWICCFKLCRIFLDQLRRTFIVGVNLLSRSFALLIA